MTVLGEVLRDLGINPKSVPPGKVNLLNNQQISSLGETAKKWSLRPENHEALAYSLEDEFKVQGLVLRNLIKSGPAKAHLTVTNNEGPMWHGLLENLRTLYKNKLAVICEGPKDARVLISNGVPAAAYLTSVPSKGHLKVIKRYVNGIIWFPDQDYLTKEVRDRKDRVYQTCKEMNLKLYEHKIPAKDPGELAKNPEFLKRIREQWEELVSFT